MAILPALAAIATVGAAGASAYSAFKKPKTAAPAQMKAPSAKKPNVLSTPGEAKAPGIQNRGGFSLFSTGPSGLLADPTTARNTLLGS